jgi:hypothetical protein
MLGGLLLTTRRTTLLGALVSIGVLGNVVMLNFSYDVPVKLFSSHLLAMAIFLAGPDLGRFANFFLFNRTAEPVPYRILLGRRWLHYSALALRTALVVAYLGWALYISQQSRKLYGDLAQRSPLYGIWSVEEFAVDGKVQPALFTDGTRWRRVVFDSPRMIAIQLASDSRRRYMLNLDFAKKLMTLTRFDDPAWKSVFSYKQPEPELLELEGTLDGKKIAAKLRRTDESALLLKSRGFHWINELPFNR